MKKHKLSEGKEELVRALLLMKYDTKKTLTENQENIKSQLKEDVGAAAIGAGVGGAAIGAGVGAALPTSLAIGAAGTGAAGTGVASGLVYSLAGTLGIGATAAGAIIGGAAAVAVLPLVYWLVTKDDGADRVKALIQMCSTNANAISKLPRNINDTTIRDLSDKINDAVNYQTLGFMAGTDEESLFEAFNALGNGKAQGCSASDACALINKYNQDYGDLWDDLDSDIDAESEWIQIYRPLRNCIEGSLDDITPSDPCKDKPGTVWDNNVKACIVITPPKPGPDKWRECIDFPLTKGCKGDKVCKIQNCLGISADCKFGSGTEKALSNEGYSTTVTQEIYDKIMSNCGGITTTTTTLPQSPDRETEYSDVD
jgi:hypothetical protein